jgi:hypothetical protein
VVVVVGTSSSEQGLLQENSLAFCRSSGVLFQLLLGLVLQVAILVVV